MDSPRKPPRSRLPRVAWRAFTFASAVSAVLGIAAVILIAADPQSYSPHDSAIVRGPGGAYSVRLQYYNMIILGPTRPWSARPGVNREEFVKSIAQMSNADIRWVGRYPYAQAHAIDLLRQDANVVRNELLDALGDPNRFAIAHLLLRCCSHDFVRCDVKEGSAYFEGLERPISIGTSDIYDPAQIPRLREMWIDALRVPIFNIGYGKAPFWFGVLPAAWIAAASLRRWKQRRIRPGFCPVCGYDLRATPLRCPECGNTDLQSV
ncbi:MAG TPA: hypothetical protein VH370_27780 [Humisphaera sp.]|jgi:hypothetical protein|nr:hypothetical protein [Humisphaera sp.]